MIPLRIWPPPGSCSSPPLPPLFLVVTTEVCPLLLLWYRRTGYLPRELVPRPPLFCLRRRRCFLPPPLPPPPPASPTIFEIPLNFWGRLPPKHRWLFMRIILSHSNRVLSVSTSRIRPPPGSCSSAPILFPPFPFFFFLRLPPKHLQTMAVIVNSACMLSTNRSIVGERLEDSASLPEIFFLTLLLLRFPPSPI